LFNDALVDVVVVSIGNVSTGFTAEVVVLLLLTAFEPSSPSD
jgi:hypothetical protein